VPGFDLTHNGGVDAFVAKVDPAGATLLYASYIGGSGDDRGNGIAVDAAGNAYITGETNSTQTTFPDGNGFGAIPGFDLTQNGGVDAFVAKVNAAGTALLYATYIGGSGDDRGNGIAVDAVGNAYITGETNSTEATFPDGDGFGLIPGFDLTQNGGVDAFVAELDAAGTTLVFGAYIGGAGDDRGKGIAVDAAGDVYIAGETNSTETTFPVKTGPDQAQNLGFDAFVAKICNSICIDVSVTQSDSPDPVRAGDNLAYTITVHNSGPNDATGVQLTETLASSLILVSVTPSSGSCALGAPIICDLGNMANGSSITVNLVTTTTGTGTVVSTASVTADQTDTDLVNNSDAEKTVVTLPNLIVSVLNAAAAVIPGADVVITDTTKNNGAISAAASTTKFYLSTDNKFDAGDVFLGSRVVVALAAKQGNTGSTTVTIPPGTPLGNYFLIAVADAGNVVAETNDTNKKSRKLSVTRPDLTVSRLQSPSSAAAGSALVIKETTSNKTAVSAGNSTTSYYLSADAILDGSDTLLAGRPVPALAAKGNSAASTTVAIPVSTLPGKYYLIAVCDSANAVVEVNEGNNTRSKTITITP
ncbi:MAG: CARDB domain-containing protein, partial [Deltaproteobacteria bacterium]